MLDSLGAATEDLVIDVIVVDNGSSDATREIASSRSECRLICSDNVGYAAGLNLGIDASDAQSILVLNPDIVLHPGSIPPLASRLACSGVGIVVPCVLDEDGQLHHSLRREPTLLRATGLGSTGWPLFAEYVIDPAAYRRAGKYDWALGAAMMISRQCLREVGHWDASYFLYSEETDFCLRARDLGWATWFEPLSVVTHVGGASGRSDVTHTMQIVNRVRLYARRHHRLKGWVYLGLSVLSEISWILRGHTQSRAAVRALLRPRSRPSELRASDSLLPR